MATAAKLQETSALDRLGEALADTGCERLSLTWSRAHLGGDFFYLDGRDAQGRYLSAGGSTAGEAYRTACERVSALHEAR